jgi:hypothetical protein
MYTPVVNNILRVYVYTCCQQNITCVCMHLESTKQYMCMYAPVVNKTVHVFCWLQVYTYICNILLTTCAYIHMYYYFVDYRCIHTNILFCWLQMYTYICTVLLTTDVYIQMYCFVDYRFIHTHVLLFCWLQVYSYTCTVLLTTVVYTCSQQNSTFVCIHL